MQLMYASIKGVSRRLTLPAAASEVLPGIPWGAFDELLTPAYWRGQAWQHELLETYSTLRLGRSLEEELAACLLGGYGMAAELGLAAFARLRSAGLLEGRLDAESIERALATPFAIRGRQRRYRFPRQKSKYLVAAVSGLGSLNVDVDDSDLRDSLATLPGVGPKTASWIVRNYRNSDQVAVIDIHILRAGRLMQLFPPAESPERHYRHLERRFLSLAVALKTRAATLDALMWDYMRRLSSARALPQYVA